jgi:hypothetical protein
MDLHGLRVVSLMGSMMSPRTVGAIARLVGRDTLGRPPATPKMLVDIAKSEAITSIPKFVICSDYRTRP